jgi:hypothetical protein
MERHIESMSRLPKANAVQPSLRVVKCSKFTLAGSHQERTVEVRTQGPEFEVRIHSLTVKTDSTRR